MESTDEDIIQRVVQMFDLSYIQTRRHEQLRKANWKPSYIANIRGRKAEGIMRAVYPHMGIKRKSQIERALTSIGKSI